LVDRMKKRECQPRSTKNMTMHFTD